MSETDFPQSVKDSFIIKCSFVFLEWVEFCEVKFGRRFSMETNNFSKFSSSADSRISALFSPT